jgi:hypothetical protein
VSIGFKQTNQREFLDVLHAKPSQFEEEKQWIKLKEVRLMMQSPWQGPQTE